VLQVDRKKQNKEDVSRMMMILFLLLKKNSLCTLI